MDLSRLLSICSLNREYKKLPDLSTLYPYTLLDTSWKSGYFPPIISDASWTSRNPLYGRLVAFHDKWGCCSSIDAMGSWLLALYDHKRKGFGRDGSLLVSAGKGLTFLAHIGWLDGL